MDVASIMVAYFVGIHQINFVVGLAYAVFDAVLVVWMRKPITRLVRTVLAIRGGRAHIRDFYVADLT